MRCSVHLINEGVTQRSNANDEVVTVIEWGISVPTDVVESEVTFRCILDGQSTNNCGLFHTDTDSDVQTLGPYPLIRQYTLGNFLAYTLWYQSAARSRIQPKILCLKGGGFFRHRHY